MTQRKRLFVFDQAVCAASPAGSCVLAELGGLSSQFAITVFADRFDAAAAPPDVRWIRIPLPSGPVLVRYGIYQFLAPFAAAWVRWVDRQRPDFIQSTEGQYARADVAYAHFCHRAYLRGPWKSSPVRGVRRIARWLNHSFNAFWERRTYRKARCVIAPSKGLARELESFYPELKGRVRTIPNPVDLARYGRPDAFDRGDFRRTLGLAPSETVFVFAALGDFGRKGLGIVLEALAHMPAEHRDRARILVVGGGAGEIADFNRQAERLAVADRTKFVGLQSDVRPFLWASDLLVFPSAYEIFSLVILQAAAASLPVIVTSGLYGAEEFVIDGVNGWSVPRTAERVREAMHSALADPSQLSAMAARARSSVTQYAVDVFKSKWARLYGDLLEKR